MRWVLAALLVFIYLIVTQQCARADVTANVGISKGVLDHGSFEKFGAVTVSTPGPAFLKAGLGGWLDYAPGRAHAWFPFAGVGLRVKSSGGLYAETGIAFARISKTDALLGSHAQFFFSCELGIRDSSGLGMGAGYFHVSNASLWPGPNMGRDFGALGVSYAW